MEEIHVEKLKWDKREDCYEAHESCRSRTYQKNEKKTSENHYVGEAGCDDR